MSVSSGASRRATRSASRIRSPTRRTTPPNTSRRRDPNSFPQNSRDLEAWFGPSDYDVRHRLSTNSSWSCRSAEHGLARRDWVVVGHLRLALRTAVHGQPERQQRRPEHDRPPESGRTTPRARKQWSSGSTRRRSRRCVRHVRQRAAQRPARPGLAELRHDGAAADPARPARAATVRWDIFNVFNTMNFGLPKRNISDAATFGTISTLSGDPRIMQLSARITF